MAKILVHPSAMQKTFVYEYEARFGIAIKRGAKRITIRAYKESYLVPRPGDYIQHVVDNGRTVVATTVCTEVLPMVLEETFDVMLDNRRLDMFERAELARQDGFDGFLALHAFFAKRYGIPFRGWLIKWA